MMSAEVVSVKAPIASCGYAYKPMKFPSHNLPGWVRFLSCLVFLLGIGGLSNTQAAAVLSITPITFNVIGLDSNNVNAGPNTYPVGARVCNIGDVSATGVTSTMTLTGGTTNPYISLNGLTTVSFGTLPSGPVPPSSYSIQNIPANCRDAYFTVVIARNTAAYSSLISATATPAQRNTQFYAITASATGVSQVSTPTPRELFVEHLVSQNRNSVQSFTGPSSVSVGQVATYTLNASTATGGYEQLENFPVLPNSVFEILNISTTYTAPTGGVNSAAYADACGWENVITSLNYHNNGSCIGPANYSGGKAGNTIQSVYTVRIISGGNSGVFNVIYDFSGSSYHYNSDYGTSGNGFSVTATAPDLTLSKSHTGSFTVGQTATFTFTVKTTGADAYGTTTVTDALPAGLSLPNGPVTLSGTNATSWTCSSLNNTITCTSTNASGTALITAGNTSSFNVTGIAVSSAASPSVTNTASVSNPNETATGNNTATDTATVIAPPQLTLNKTIAAPGRVNAADQFTVQLKNGTTVTTSASTSTTGTTASTGATTLVSGTSYTLTEVMAAGSASTLTSYNTALTCTNSTAGSATVLPGGAGQSFTVTPTNGDIISCTLTNTPKQTDLAISKTGPSLVTLGGTLTYTIKVWNIGPDSATGATITDTVPSNLTGVTWTCAANGSAACGTTSGNGNIISFSSGSLPVNNTSTPPTSGSYLTVTVTGSASTAGNITNTATVTSPAGSLDPVNGNNSSSQATTINNPPSTANVTNVVLLNTAASTTLNPNLSATDTDGTIANYTIVTLPAAAGGVLSVNGVAVTAGQSFTAAQLNSLSFDPAAGFSGNASFTYTATDNQGGLSNTSTYTIPVNNPPTTANLTNTTLLDTAPATVLTPNLSAADTDGTIASYTIVTLPATASGVLALNGTAITAGQVITAANLGNLTFDPAAGFNGNASFTYSATDNQGAGSNTSAYTIPVNVAPVAVSDTSSTPTNTTKTFSVTGNDTDTSPGTINVASTVFTTSGQPAGSTLSNGNRTISVAGEGSYTLDNAGNVAFTPVSGYSGTTTAVKYTVNDNQGATSNVANITVTVTPVAIGDAANATPSTLVNIPVLNNDLGTGKVLTSLLFPAAGQPTGSTVSNGGKTLTNADGVYTIKTDGTVDFTPALGKTGTLTPVLYTFVDGAGQTSNPATITVTVSSIVPPTATNDSKATPKSTAVTLEGSTNDTAGNLPIDNASVVFLATQPAGATVSNAGKTLTFTGQGTYQVQANGTVIFTPVSTFAGTTTPVNYTVKDTAGNTSNVATLTVTVTNQPPVANSVTNALVTSTAPAAALNPGVSGTDLDGTVVTYTVTVLPTAAMGTLYCNGTAIASVPTSCAPAQLSFQPNPAFNGDATFQYTVTDDNGATSAAATYTIPVNKPPVATNDSGATNPNVSVTFSITGNDTDTAPGTVDVTTAMFDPSSTGTISNAGKTLTIVGEGVYTIASNGNVTFAPAAGFNNGVSTAKYTVKDNQGATSNVATITVNVPASVDLAISKVGPLYFKPGDTLSYTLTVTNSGSAASGVTVTDTLPTGLTFASANSGGTYSAATGMVSWMVGAVANGASVTLTLTGTAPLAASVETNNGPTSLVNTATTQANETEVVTANNTASAPSQLVYPKLTKRLRNVTQNSAFGTTGTGKPGEVLEYCIDFKNYGVAVANFVVSDTVPSNTNASLSAYGSGLGLQVVRGGTTTRTSSSGDADGGSLSSAALSLDLGTLAAGESGSVCFQANIK